MSDYDLWPVGDLRKARITFLDPNARADLRNRTHRVHTSKPADDISYFDPPFPWFQYCECHRSSIQWRDLANRECKFNTNLLTIPSTAIGMFALLGITWLSEFLNERTFVSMVQTLWTLPCILALRFWPGALKDPWPTYALITVLLSYPYCHAIVV